MDHLNWKPAIAVNNKSPDLSVDDVTVFKSLYIRYRHYYWFNKRTSNPVNDRNRY